MQRAQDNIYVASIFTGDRGTEERGAGGRGTDISLAERYPASGGPASLEPCREITSSLRSSQ